jgi:predicted enzyme related to lactoylglutathione lyase
MSDSRLTAVCPVFQVADLQRALEFYDSVLELTTGWAG